MTPEKLSSFESEQIWLGTVILHERGDLITEHGICAEHFYSSIHKMIFTACNRIHNKRLTVEATMVAKELGDMDCLDMAGGFGYIAEICKNTSKSNARYRLVSRRASKQTNLLIYESYNVKAHLFFSLMTDFTSNPPALLRQ